MAFPLRRWTGALVFVAVWMGLGWSLRLNAQAYLIAGVPLTVLFQRFVRRAPLRALWVREAPAPGRGWIGLAVLLAIAPAVSLVPTVMHRQWWQAGWMLCALAGAGAAGYALGNFQRNAVRPFLLCLFSAGSIGIALMLAARAGQKVSLPILPLGGLVDFLLLFPVCFVVEEVSFRGALDGHLYQRCDRFGLLSACFGAILWGLWHLPILPRESQGLAAALGLMVVHLLIGVPLALGWRQSGNLVVPAFTHALIDAVRNALRLIG